MGVTVFIFVYSAPLIVKTAEQIVVVRLFCIGAFDFSNRSQKQRKMDECNFYVEMHSPSSRDFFVFWQPYFHEIRMRVDLLCDSMPKRILIGIHVWKMVYSHRFDP